MINSTDFDLKLYCNCRIEHGLDNYVLYVCQTEKYIYTIEGEYKREYCPDIYGMCILEELIYTVVYDGKYYYVEEEGKCFRMLFF